jgi:hypothetical protein
MGSEPTVTVLPPALPLESELNPAFPSRGTHRHQRHAQRVVAGAVLPVPDVEAKPEVPRVHPWRRKQAVDMRGRVFKDPLFREWCLSNKADDMEARDGWQPYRSVDYQRPEDQARWDRVR